MVSAAFATLTLMSRLPASTPSLCLSAAVELALDLLQTWLHQVTESTDFNDLMDKEPWLSSTRLVVKPDMVFGKRGKSGLVALNLDLAGIAAFVKERLGKEVEIGGCKEPITTFIDPLGSNLGNSMLGFSSLLMGEKKCSDFEASSLSRRSSDVLLSRRKD